MSDWAYEIAREAEDYFESEEQVFALAARIRAYGEERAVDAYDDGLTEGRMDVLKEVVEVVDRHMIKSNASVSWARLVQNILALEEKP